MRKHYLILVLILGALVFTGVSCVQLGGGGQGPMGIFRSDDSGEKWQAKGSLPTLQGVRNLAGLKVYRSFNDPSDPNALYVGTRGQGLYYTYTNGEVWEVSDAMNGKFIYGVAVDPRDKCTVYVTDGPHIYKTTDCLRTWELQFTEERPNQRFVALVVDYNNSNVIYGAELGGDVFRSTDEGRSWRIVKRFDFELRHLAVDPLVPNRLYAASYNRGLHRSDDGGINWIDVSASFKNFTDSYTFYRLMLNPAQRNSLFWISKYGILRSDDAGASWTDLKLLTPPGSVNIYSFAVNPKNPSELYYTGTILGDRNRNLRSTLYKSTDGGTTWVTKKLPTNTIPVDMYVNPDKPSTIFLGFTTL